MYGTSLKQALGPEKNTDLIKVLDLSLPSNQVQTETILFDGREADLVTRGVARGQNEDILDQVHTAQHTPSLPFATSHSQKESGASVFSRAAWARAAREEYLAAIRHCIDCRLVVVYNARWRR